MRSRVWDLFSGIVSLFDFRVEKIFPDQKNKRRFLRALAIVFLPVIVPAFIVFSLVDSVADILHG